MNKTILTYGGGKDKIIYLQNKEPMLHFNCLRKVWAVFFRRCSRYPGTCFRGKNSIKKGKTMNDKYLFKTPQTDWHNFAGKLSFRINNDYLFRALLQFDNAVLKELIASLLRWNTDDIISAEIQNPIILGESLEAKYYVLDVRVMLNNSIIMNLEMQIIDERNWPERSLCYLCRMFDQLNRGDDYADIKPAYQIGFTDFSPVQGEPEFYSTYRLLNIKNQEKYTDKFTLSVVNLSQIKLATEEDKNSKLDQWAKMFKAKTWEELRMLAEVNPAIDEAVSKIQVLTEQDRIREQIEAREEYYRIERTKMKLEQRRQERMAQMDAEIERKDAEIERKDAEIERKDAEIEQKEAELEKKEAELEKKGVELERKDAELDNLKNENAVLRGKLEAAGLSLT